MINGIQESEKKKTKKSSQGTRSMISRACSSKNNSAFMTTANKYT